MKQRIYPFIFFYFLTIIIISCSPSDQNDSQSQTASEDSSQTPTSEIAYTAPEGWLQHPPISKMRKDQYVLPGTEGKEDGELIVYHFPEMAGMIDANINRWYSQFQQPDGSDTAAKAVSKTETINNIPVTTVFATGTYLKPQNPMDIAGPNEEKTHYAMLAAI
ncbi:MAG: hypothetical protein ACE5I1_06065, partial [bacterium]